MKQKISTRDTLTTDLRFGWTTGTCATAASVAAYRGMVSGNFPQEVEIETPSGKIAYLEVTTARKVGEGFMAGIIKDAGDDPDVTHGAEIRATLKEGIKGTGITLLGGEGVGVVTKAGLPIEVGAAAINPIPRKMITEALTELATSLNGTSDIEVTISVPKGKALAKKTWNPRLGIEGGISILGTTGVVRPFSCSAWIASIHRGIDVARANGITHVAGSTGATSEASVKAHYNLEDSALLDMGDFVGGMLKYLRKHPIPQVTIAGGFGKMVKLAQGHGDLHSKRSQVDFAMLAEMASSVTGLDKKAIISANTALEVLELASAEGSAKALAEVIAEAALKTAKDILSNDEVKLEVMLIRRGGQLLAKTGEGHA